MASKASKRNKKGRHQKARRSGLPESLPNKGGRWLEPAIGWLDKESLVYVLGILGIAVIFFLCLYNLAPDRSFHPDELHVLAVEKKEYAGVEMEGQHRFYHDFYQHWIAKEYSERWARIPSMVFVTLGLLSLAALAGRLYGRETAVVAAACYFLWPRAWDDGLEMRYYGLMFLAATLSLHAFLSLLRGALVLPLIVLAVIGGFMSRWHPAAFPFQAGLLGIAIVIPVYTATRNLIAWKKDPERGPFPRAEAIKVSILIGLLIAGAIVTAKMALSRAGIDRVTGHLDDIAVERFDILDPFRWLVNWVNDSHAPDFLPLKVLRLSFPALLIAGTVALHRKQRGFVYTCLLLLAAQIAAAGLFSLSWTRMAIGYKYLTSSSVYLLLALSVGMVWLVRWGASRSRSLAYASAGSIVLLYFLPVLPRVQVSALGDASHYRQFWARVLEEADGTPPLVYARSETTQSIRPYFYLLPDLNITAVYQYDFDTAAVPALFCRDQPLFVALSGEKLAEFPFRDSLEEIEYYRSNFTSSWDIALMRSRSEARRVETYMEDDRSLPGAFAAAGPIDSESGPLSTKHGLSYRLAGALTVEYDLPVPADSQVLSINVSSDSGTNDALYTQVNGELIGLYKPVDDAATTDTLEILIPTEEYAGQDIRLTLSRFQRSAHQLKRDGDVSAMTIHSLTFREGGEDYLRPENVLHDFDCNPVPGYAPDGWVDVEDLGLWTVDLAASPDHPIQLESKDGFIRLQLPRDMRSQQAYIKPFPVKPNNMSLIEVEMRARNLIRKNAVVVINYVTASGQLITPHDTISGQTVGQFDVTWTKRFGYSIAPENAAVAILGIYINSPEGLRLREDAAVDVRSIRFFDPSTN